MRASALLFFVCVALHFLFALVHFFLLSVSSERFLFCRCTPASVLIGGARAIAQRRWRRRFFLFYFLPPPSLPIFFSFILAISFINRWTIGQSMNKCMKLICRRGQRRHLVIGLAMSTTPPDDVCLSRSSVYLSTYVRVCLCVLVCVCECVCVSRSIDLQNNAT